MTARCLACGAPLLPEPTGPAYDHTPDCRIGRRVVMRPTYAETLNSPGERAIIAWGGLMSDGLDEDAAWAKLTPEQRQLAGAELKALEATHLRARR